MKEYFAFLTLPAMGAAPTQQIRFAFEANDDYTAGQFAVMLADNMTARESSPEMYQWSGEAISKLQEGA